MYAEVSTLVPGENSRLCGVCQRDSPHYLGRPQQREHHFRQFLGAVRARGQREFGSHCREDEHPSCARTYALISRPAKTVQCGEERGGIDPAEGPEWGPVHQLLHHSNP